MSLSDTSVKRPVAISCLIIALTMLGLNAYRKFALEFIPKIDMPYVTVVTAYPGATPTDIETDVAKRIEDVVTEVDGLKHVTSSCMDNVCNTILEFHLGTNVDVAAMDVREKLDKIMSDFPSDVEKPVVLKYDVNAKAIVTVALTGDVDIDELYDYADNTLRDRLSVITGVANVDLIGGSQREVHVELQRNALAAASLTTMHVVEAVQNGVLTLPSGRIKEHGSEYGVRFDAEYVNVKEIGDLQVAGYGGARRYVRDLGNVTMATEERRQACFIDGKACIGIRVVQKADANAVRVVNGVRRVISAMRSRLPGGMELVWVTDDGSFTQASVDSTTKNVLEGIILTSAILFFFLYNFRALLIVAITMPLTVVISLFFMYSIGLTLNIITLMAIGLSLGIGVMNSIVVLESVVTHLAKSIDTWEAARTGTGEIAIALVGCAGTNVVVLLPIGMMTTMIAEVFRPFAWTILIYNLVSIFLSLTLMPVLCAAVLKKTEHAHGLLATLDRWWNKALEAFATALVAALRFCSTRKWICASLLAVSMAIFIHSLMLAPKIGFGFMPQLDRGEVFVKLEYPTRQNLAQTVARVREVEACLRTIPLVQHIFTQIGKVEGLMGKTSEGVYLVQLLVKFPDKTERSANINELLRQVRHVLRNHAGCLVNVSIASPIGGEEIPIEMEICGDELPQLEESALAIQDIMRKDLPGFTEVDTSVRDGKMELRVLPNRPILVDMGASIRSLGLMTRANLEGIKASIYRSGVRTYDIRVKLAEEPGKSQLKEFLVPVGEQRRVTLNALAKITENVSPVLITRVDKRRIIKIYSQLLPGFPMGTAMDILTAAIARLNLLPAGYEHNFRGLSEHMVEAVGGFLEATILAVLLTYLTLAAILESFSRPFLIMLTIPLGLIGVMWSLYLTGESMGMFVLLGMVLLIGIVVNNAILILDRMQQLLTQGVEPREAMLEAIHIEFRAVLMVTLAAILGMLPLAIASGLGSEMSIGIGISSVGGILVSAVLTLVVIPLIYLLFVRRSH